MLIVGLNGSPNKDGNTKQLLAHGLETAARLGVDTEIIEVADVMMGLPTKFCTACSVPCSGICYKNSRLEEAYGLLRKADGLLFGSPVHFGTVSAQLKAFFDMSRKLRIEKALYNKVAAGLSVGATRFGGQETTIKALHDIILVHGMMIIGDGYSGDYCGHHGVCAVMPAKDDAFSMSRTEILAKRMVEVCGATAAIR